MTWIDIIQMAWHNLWQRKLRSSLNLIGVVLGSVIILLTTAGATGVEDAVRALFDSSEFAREVSVRPSFGRNIKTPETILKIAEEVPPGRRERLRQVIQQTWRLTQTRPADYEIPLERLQQLRQLRGVARVVPTTSVTCIVSSAPWMNPNKEAGWLGDRTDAISIDVDRSTTRKRLVAGRVIDELNRHSEILVSELQAYRMGFGTDDALRQLLGQEITINYQINAGKINVLSRVMGANRLVSPEDQVRLATVMTKAINAIDESKLQPGEFAMMQQFVKTFLPDSKPETPVTRSRTFKIVGVLRDEDADLNISTLFRRFTGSNHQDLMLHHQTALELHREHLGRTQLRQVKLVVDSTRHLEETEAAIEQLGLGSNSALWALKQVETQIDATAWIIYGIAITILGTSAIGITNTLIISVMQRTQEFGILKAIGMTDRSLMGMMVFEGALLGLVGAILATLIALLCSWLGHGWLNAYLENRVGESIQGQLIKFSFWPVMFTASIAVSICALASIFPAWRAARLDPVAAMRRD